MSRRLARMPVATAILLFATYSYATTVIAAAWYLRRGAEGGLGVIESLARAAALYSPWLWVALVVWLILRRLGPEWRGVGVLALATLPVVIAVATATAWIQSLWTSGTPPLVTAVIDRLPVMILLYTAVCAIGLATAHWRRAREARALIDDLNQALADARTAARSSPPDTVLASIGRRRVRILIADIEWIASAGNYVVLHWSGQEALLRETLKTLENSLDPRLFVRCHRTALVNLARSREATPLSDGSWRLTLDSGAELVVSRTYRDQVLARLGREISRPDPAAPVPPG